MTEEQLATERGFASERKTAKQERILCLLMY